MPTVRFNTHFPGYDILGELNRSNARVLKARHLATGDLVAIKHFALNTDADTLRRFERESQIMTHINHPNIVRVREVRLDAELPYIVLDYVEGGSIRQLLTEQGTLPIELVIRLGLQVVSAFRLIHQQGIVHRDIKPENILFHRLVSGELNFLVTDFGVARLHEQPVTMTGQSLMTYEYAAPEQFDNPRMVGEAADYYALGIVFYECLTGQVPFAMKGETGMVTFMNAVMTNPPPPPVLPAGQQLPPSLDTLILQLLHKKPEARLHHPDQIKLALKQAEVEQLHQETTQITPAYTARTQPFVPINTEPIRTQTVPAPQPVPVPVAPTQKRTRSTLYLLAGGALLVTGLGVYWLLNRPAGSVSTTSATPALATTTTTSPDLAERENRQQRAERSRRLYEAQVARATRQLEAAAFGGKAGLFGGVKGLSVQVTNPSAVAFEVVAVQVRYVKENGGVFKSHTMYFNDIGPGDRLIRKAPDSQRGTRFSARVLRADPAVPDSISSLPPQIP